MYALLSVYNPPKVTTGDRRNPPNVTALACIDSTLIHGQLVDGFDVRLIGRRSKRHGQLIGEWRSHKGRDTDPLGSSAEYSRDKREKDEQRELCKRRKKCTEMKKKDSLVAIHSGTESGPTAADLVCTAGKEKEKERKKK